MPAYHIWNIAIIAVAVLLCWLPLVQRGIATLTSRRRSTEQKLPPIPLFPGSSFPNIFDTLSVLFTFTLLALASIPSVEKSEPTDVSIKSMVISCVVMLVIYLPFLLRLVHVTGHTNEMGLHRPTPLRERLLPVLSVVSLSVAFNVFFGTSGCMKAIADATDSELYQDTVVMILKGDWTLRSYIIIQALIIAPICEECFFRGFLFNALRNCRGGITATLISSLAFAAIHFSLPQLIPLFVFALLQCRLYVKTRTLAAPILAHFCFNAISVGAALLLSMTPSAP